MAKSSNLLKQAPKKKKRKTQADVDAQHIGYEPEWSSADPIQESGVQSKWLMHLIIMLILVRQNLLNSI